MGCGDLPIERIVGKGLGDVVRIPGPRMRMALRMQAPVRIVAAIHFYRANRIVYQRLRRCP